MISKKNWNNLRGYIYSLRNENLKLIFKILKYMDIIVVINVEEEIKKLKEVRNNGNNKNGFRSGRTY